jgi:hypothetical protein
MGSVCVLAYLAAARPAAQQRPAFQAAANIVSLYVTAATTAGRLVRDLTQADFDVLDDGQQAAISVFSREPQPVTAALMLDMSNSNLDNIVDLQAAGAAFVGRLLPADRLRIGTFGSEVWTTPLLTNDQGYLLRVLREELWTGGLTSVWNGIDEGMSSLAKAPGRRVVVVFTDGGNFPIGKNAKSPSVVSQRVEREQFVIYTIGVKGWLFDYRLKTLAARSGGAYVEVKPFDDLGAAFAGVVDELHEQYLIGFVPGTLDGRTHAIEVRVRRPGVIARARASYVALSGS